ncbi:MAG: peptide-methionine (S)-S-oxide reductase MsrA [Agriterribacter sp.]
MRFLFSLLGIIPASILLSCAQRSDDAQATVTMNISNDSISFNAHTEVATFGTGCFWCSEAIFQQLKGVTKVTSGYSGGTVANPTYEEVCTKNTGHAEVVQVVFDPSVITYDELLEVFWKTHDPTTLNRQGNDIGTQYRSVIFYHNQEQKQKAEKYRDELGKSGAWTNPIVTAIEPYKNFYAAENYHQDYYRLNGKEPYCQYVIAPKLEKFEKVFKDKLKGH